MVKPASARSSAMRKEGCAPGARGSGLGESSVSSFCHFFLAHPASARVVASVDKNPVRPGDKTGLTAKAADASLHFQKRFLHGILGVDWIAQ